MQATQQTVEERFWSKVELRGSDECWPWLGSRDSRNRYGQARYGGKKWQSHRLAYFLVNGHLPDAGLCLCHRCDNPPCCNPDHLFIGTQGDNLRDMFAKGRGRPQPSRGEAHTLAKLNDEKVRIIRSRAARGVTQKDLAAEFGVSPRVIGMVIKRQAWAHVI